MKKIFFTTILLLTIAGASAQGFNIPKKGYVGEAGAAFGIVVAEAGVTPSIGMFTTHGYQFSPQFFLGGGVMLTRNTKLLCTYIQTNFALRKVTESRSSFPYMSINAGYAFSTWSGDSFGDDKGVYIEPRLGWSFNSKLGNLRYDVFAAVSMFDIQFTPKIGLAFRF